MTDGLLENIIQLEKQIQANVAEEAERASSWQERELSELNRLLDATRATEEESSTRELAEREAEFRHEVAAIKAVAEAWCKRLTGLDNATLSKVLESKLAAILPGGDHDHPHGQG